MVPTSDVCPMLVMSKKSLPETEGLEGAGGAVVASRVTLNVEVVPTSAVCPEMSVMF